MLGKEVIVRFLETKAVTHLFHLPGIHTLPLNDVLLRSSLRVIVGRHESNLGFMADGFAKATGNPAVVLITPGPGLGNVATACMEAYANDIPLLFIFVDVDRKDIEKGVLHGLLKPETMFEPICKRFFRVNGEDSLFGTFEAGYATAMTQRSGPVVISVPYRLLNSESYCDARTAHGSDGASNINEDGPDFFAEALRERKRPVIIGGGAIMDGSSAVVLDTICRGCGIPFLSTTSGKGVVSEDSEYAFGNIVTKGVVREIMKSADVTIVLGSRLRDVDAKRRGVRVTSLIHADVDDRWLGKNYRTDVQVAGDMRKALSGLGAAVAGKRFSWPMKELREARDRERVELGKNSMGFSVVRLLRRCIPHNTITVWDLNLIGYWAEYYFPVVHQRTFLMAQGMSPIFYALPAAIGAKLGKPGNPCLCVTGDASFVATAEELATIKQNNVPVVVLVYNNSAFGILEQYMEKRYGASGSMQLVTPDLLEIAHAFDVKAARAETLEELERIFLNNVTWNEPFLVDFRFPIFPPPWE